MASFTNGEFARQYNEEKLGPLWLLVAAISDFIARTTATDLVKVNDFIAEQRTDWIEALAIHAIALRQQSGTPAFAYAISAITLVQDSGSEHTQKLVADEATCRAVNELAMLASMLTLDQCRQKQLLTMLVSELIRRAEQLPKTCTGITRGITPLLLVMRDAPNHYDQNWVRYELATAACVEDRRHIMCGAVMLRQQTNATTSHYEGQSP